MPENLPHRAPANTPMQAQTWEGELPSRIAAAFPALSFGFFSFQQQHFLEAPAESIVEVIRYLRDEEQFDMLTDLTAVDRPSEAHKPPGAASDERRNSADLAAAGESVVRVSLPAKRFEVIYILYSFQRNDRVRVKVRCALDEAIPSVTSLYAGANWLEREVFDMFGIRFDGHPNLKRILLPEDWSGFPLRKEAPITGMDNEWVQRNLGIKSGQS